MVNIQLYFYLSIMVEITSRWNMDERLWTLLSSMVVSCHLQPPLMKLFILRDLDSGVLTWELSPNILSAVLLIGRISFSEKIL